jgi:hypothetical protein
LEDNWQMLPNGRLKDDTLGALAYSLSRWGDGWKILGQSKSDKRAHMSKKDLNLGVLSDIMFPMEEVCGCWNGVRNRAFLWPWPCDHKGEEMESGVYEGLILKCCKRIRFGRGYNLRMIASCGRVEHR